MWRHVGMISSLIPADGSFGLKAASTNGGQLSIPALLPGKASKSMLGGRDVHRSIFSITCLHWVSSPVSVCFCQGSDPRRPSVGGSHGSNIPRRRSTKNARHGFNQSLSHIAKLETNKQGQGKISKENLAPGFCVAPCRLSGIPHLQVLQSTISTSRRCQTLG